MAMEEKKMIMQLGFVLILVCVILWGIYVAVRALMKS